MDHPDDMNISGDLENLDTSTEITTAQLLAQLKDIWRNERLAPELLPHHEEIVELLLDQIKEMDKNVDKAKAKEPYRCHIHKMELDRVRYMLSNYLRCRLEKLENYTIHYRYE
jgi:GINS complex subunit 4